MLAWTSILGRERKKKGRGSGPIGDRTDEELRDWMWRVRKRLEPLSTQWCHHCDREGTRTS